MKSFNKEKYNELCASFLGARYYPASKEYELYGVLECIEDGENEKHFFTPHSMEFDSDWNWIMEVVEKIEKECGVSIVGGPVKKPTCVIYLGNLKAKSGQGNSKKEAVVQAIWEFLNWYNEQSK